MEGKTLFETVPWSEKQQILGAAVQKKADELFIVLTELTPSRERSLATTKLEEAIMWAHKSLSRNDG